MYCSVLPSISPCLIPTTTVRERRQGAIVTGGGPSGVLRPLAGASESVNQCDLGIGTERGVTLLVLELMARNNYLVQNGNNSTLQCIFSEEKGALSSNFDIKWMVLPNILNAISIVTLGIGGIEFICAQTPYSMKGVMVGTVYGSMGIITIIGYGITVPFTMNLITWSTGVISCGFWYLLLVIIVLIFNSTLLLILGKLYKNRKREDVLPNEQIFAERYYSHTISDT